MNLNEKRRVPPALQKLLDYDADITQKLVLWANKFLPLRSLRIHYKALEITCHGVPWFACWLAFMWTWTNQGLVEMQINMLIGLIIDVVLVAFIKAYTRRRRPIANTDDMLGQIGPDKFAFPSGHASRSVYIAYFFINLYPLPIIFYPPLLAWTTAICLSRLLLNRHHVLDITAGVFLGIFQGFLLGIIWINQSTAVWLWTMLSDEKLDGGEYHV